MHILSDFLQNKQTNANNTQSYGTPEPSETRNIMSKSKRGNLTTTEMQHLPNTASEELYISPAEYNLALRKEFISEAVTIE